MNGWSPERKRLVAGMALGAAVALSSPLAGAVYYTYPYYPAPVGVADLAVVKEDDPDPVRQDDMLEYEIRVTNQSLEEAKGVGLKDRLPETVRLLKAGVETGAGLDEDACAMSVNEPGTLECELGSLAPETTRVVLVLVVPEQPGVITNEAIVFSSALDLDASDNRWVEQTTVVEP